MGSLSSTQWKLRQNAGAWGIGQNQGYPDWYTSSTSDLSNKSSIFDDIIKFNGDGSYEHIMGGLTWLEPWQGVAEGPGVPIYPHNGTDSGDSKSYTWQENNGELTLNGYGAHLGLSKVINNAELNAGSSIPNSIVYKYHFDNEGYLIFDIYVATIPGQGWWRFEYEPIVMTPITNNNIQVAVDLWGNDQNTAQNTYGHISTWDTSLVTDMSYLFQNWTSFNEDINGWNTSNVTNMQGMFFNAHAFNRDLNSWDTSEVRNMFTMFWDANEFNGKINGWNTSNVTNMMSMFNKASVFNQDIGNWNTSGVTNMAFMFYNASAFNQPINTNGDKWNTSNVINMMSMFEGANDFNQDLSDWILPAGINAGSVGQDTYDALTTYTPSSPASPASPASAAPICFPKGTPVLTNLGPIAIEKLNPNTHTVRGKQIVAITKSIPLQKHIVCFEKDSLTKDVPSQRTLCSMEHKVFCKGKMMKARDIVNVCEHVTFIPYNGEPLYNVLLKKHDKMMINNLICETLHPKNIMAKINAIQNEKKKNKVIRQLTKIIKENNITEYKKLKASLPCV